MSDRSSSTQSERNARIDELTRQIAELDEQRRPLVDERARLRTEQAREDWPAGPFGLHYFQHGGRVLQEFDSPLGALGFAEYLTDTGDGYPDSIVDSHGTRIYAVENLVWKRLVDGYPEPPE